MFIIASFPAHLHWNVYSSTCTGTRVAIQKRIGFFPEYSVVTSKKEGYVFTYVSLSVCLLNGITQKRDIKYLWNFCGMVGHNPGLID